MALPTALFLWTDVLEINGRQCICTFVLDSCYRYEPAGYVSDSAAREPDKPEDKPEAQPETHVPPDEAEDEAGAEAEEETVTDHWRKSGHEAEDFLDSESDGEMSDGCAMALFLADACMSLCDLLSALLGRCMVVVWNAASQMVNAHLMSLFVVDSDALPLFLFPTFYCKEGCPTVLSSSRDFWHWRASDFFSS